MGSLLLATSSCSDTWDDHYGSDSGSAATETLWQQIKSNSNLSRFASIAEAARYYKDEKHPSKNSLTGEEFTYDQLLNSGQIMTVWAPENEAFTEDTYNYWLQQAKTNGYAVQQQIIANSIALWRNNISTGRMDTLRMLNGKIMVFDQKGKTMAGVPLNEMNIPASNGILHTTKTVLPFNYNIYEYIKDGQNAQQNNIMRFHDYVVKTDTTYFNENASLEGNPDENGYPVYVDSVYTTSNTMFNTTHRNSLNRPEDDLTAMESFGAHIEIEDSSFIMLVPTDVAWQNAYDMLKPLYNYADNYLDNEKVNKNMTGNREITEAAKDSLLRQSLDMDIISPLCFNVNIQPNAAGRKGTWTAESFLQDKGASAKYLLNTFGDTLRSDANWDKSSLFEGKQIKMSNGYGLVTDNWSVPRKLYKPNLNVEVGYMSFYNASDNASKQAEGSPRGYSFSNATDWCDTTGLVSYNNFYYIFPKNSTANPTNEFRLVGTNGENHESEVMSGKYDIKIVFVPNYYITSNDSAIVLTVGDKGSGFIVKSGENKGDTIPVKHKLKATLSYINNEGVDNKGYAKLTTLQSDPIVYEGTKVDTLTIFEDFVFPYSYKNLTHSYPTLTLTTDTKKADRDAGYSNDFCIDQIILVSKEDDTVIAVKNFKKED